MNTIGVEKASAGFNNKNRNNYEENQHGKQNDKSSEEVISNSLIFPEGVENRENDDEELGPTSERWDPLGADNNDSEDDVINNYQQFENENCEQYQNDGQPQGDVPTSARLKSLEEEQEILTTSLMALTSHFAQVQFRLRQIVDAPIDRRDQLLKNLEEFAFRGVPQFSENLVTSGSEKVPNLGRARQRQFDLIDRLKSQLHELEKFAYETGAPVLPQSILIEKQKILIDELRNKLNFNFNELDLPQLTQQDLRNHVDLAIGEFIGPFKMKEQLVLQLKTQITDLERFIAFLQCNTTGIQGTTVTKTAIEKDKLQYKLHQKFNNYTNDVKSFDLVYNSYSAKKRNNDFNCLRLKEQQQQKGNKIKQQILDSNLEQEEMCDVDIERRVMKKLSKSSLTKSPVKQKSVGENTESLNTQAHNLMDKASTLLQMFALAQFGCGSNRFQKNSLKRTSRINHWGDTRAQLEVDIQEILSFAMTLKSERVRQHEQNNIAASSKTSITTRNHETINNMVSTYGTKYTTNSDDDDDDNSNGINKTLIPEYKKKAHPEKSTIKSPSQIKAFAFSKNDLFSFTNVELTSYIRCNFAITLQKLIQHGLHDNTQTTATSLVPFIGCFSTSSTSPRNLHNSFNDIKGNKLTVKTKSNIKSSGDDSDENMNNDQDDQNCKFDNLSDFNNGDNVGGIRQQMHAWQLIMEYYNIKNGDKYNDTPARKLSESFNLDIIGGTAISNKQSLLSTIGNIVGMHMPYKRSLNSHFKAFICAALNSQKLVVWLNLIFQCSELINTYYTNWSYVQCTGFRDALCSLDRLTKYEFDLPVDLAIRQFQNIKDVFM